MVYPNLLGDMLESYVLDLKPRSCKTMNILVSGGLPHPRAVAECQQTLSEMIGANGDVTVIFGDQPLINFYETVKDADVYLRIFDSSKSLEMNLLYIKDAENLGKKAFMLRNYNLAQMEILLKKEINNVC